MTQLLQVHNLSVSFFTRDQEVEAVRNVSFEVNRGETIGIVGESGSGKSVTARTIMRLLPSPPSIVKGGQVLFQGENLADKTDAEMEHIRGKEIGMIFQDPMSSLNPTMRIGRQIEESLNKHRKLSGSEARKEAIALLDMVGIPNSEARYEQYPHEFSGGMRQRVMIAIALACRPSLLIADEPTTSLDVTIQAQILHELKTIQRQLGTAVILITHDLGVVAGMCDRVVVMKDGEIVESGTTEQIFADPKHPYTKKLLQALPRLDEPKKPKPLPVIARPADDVPLLEVRSLRQHFDLGKGQTVKAVNDISFHIEAGETLGVVGESGSGKSTTGRTILRLHEATGGEVLFRGIPLQGLNRTEMKTMRRHMGIIFQDPYASLNPRLRVADLIGETLDVHGLHKGKKERQKRVEELLEMVGLQASHAQRYPHEFSGGQRQRIGIARTLAVSPEFIVCDEPLSALDVSIQAQIVKLLEELQQRLGLTYLFIAHDLSMVKHISDRVAVMYKGKIVELAESEELYANPIHPYTQSLLSAIPVPDPAVESRKSAPIRTEADAADPYGLERSRFIEARPGHWVAAAE
ncbi:peptide/nickel transport system ATP-binding protein [Paenibacillus phyllosphaerae]|uniref:Peptide/nickel transport system ATP-binding protein n=1 Tax=Paenibacillus phyllosphaerae TaxID=274593 RepID=A0A7W5B3P9_9BACL|nr:ABC transporter ATP-binding protein [Paenibacillus phyllosphaerae]MBB3113753.1 peptide/nickel transport system ATP-binding protein [Paenibacillus phyllosphaerae]